MEQLTYLDFDLVVKRLPDGYRVEVTRSPAGSARAEFTLPFSDIEIENVLLKLGGARRRVRRIESAEMDAAKQFGGRLFNAVFSGDVRSVYAASAQEANARDVGLRLRLHLDDAPELADLPWEFLYNPALNRFLALSVKTPVVRFLELPEQIRPLTLHPPLNVLVMLSSPTDYESLDVEREWNHLQNALGDLTRRGFVKLERLESATLTELQKKLQERAYHIFHFIGHGAFDERTQEGVLILEGVEKRGRRVGAQMLGAILHDHGSLRLAVLNSCEGARTSRNDPFAGVASSLVQQAIPAVIAMQFEISDDAAATFARSFYQALARGYPVDAALAEVRKTIFADNNEMEWGTPVLYLRAPDGKIFDVRENFAPPVAPTPTPNKPTGMPETTSPRASPRAPVQAARVKRDTPPVAFVKKYPLPLALALIALLSLVAVAASGILTPAPVCTNQALVVGSDYPPVGSTFNAGEKIPIVWRVRNTGTCAWNNTYRVSQFSGDEMTIEGAFPNTAADEEAEIEFSIVAPAFAREYQAAWRFSNPQGNFFGDKFSYVFSVRAASAAEPATPTPDKSPTQETATAEETATPQADAIYPLPTIVSEERGSTGAWMVFVPAGEFTIGTDAGGDDEKPAHQVHLDAFWIDQYEVTNTQYRECSEAGTCQPPSESGSSSRDSYYDNSDYDDYPVIFVSWRDAWTFCEWAGKRLPTEAEWESAARGPQARRYPWGNEFEQTRLNSNQVNGDTTQVGDYPDGASVYGALDMAGNVWEWVADWFGAKYYENSPHDNPTGPESGGSRELRGGAWDADEFFVRMTHRGDRAPKERNYNIGFRCAQTP